MKKQLNNKTNTTGNMVSLTTGKAQSVRGGVLNPLNPNNPINLLNPLNPFNPFS